MRAAAVVLVLLLAGCGGAEPVPEGPPVSDLRIGMFEYRFQLSAGALDPGPVTVVATNTGSSGHDVVLSQDGVEIGRTEVLAPGEQQTVEVEVAPGLPVHLECTVGGHAAAGMHTSLEVADG